MGCERRHYILLYENSAIVYALPVFGGRLTLEGAVLIDRLQNSAVRFVYGLRKYDHVSQYRRTARILPIKYIFKLQVACLVHKVLLTGKPSYLRGMLQTRAEIRTVTLGRTPCWRCPGSGWRWGGMDFNTLAPRYTTVSLTV
ncbi:hypothetical protein J6590_061792 [Homalodisca vitripennis]|nr:hypothetical protein J6590_061792 [Homalodisca vitripennis]